MNPLDGFISQLSSDISGGVADASGIKQVSAATVETANQAQQTLIYARWAIVAVVALVAVFVLVRTGIVKVK